MKMSVIPILCNLSNLRGRSNQIGSSKRVMSVITFRAARAMKLAVRLPQVPGT